MGAFEGEGTECESFGCGPVDVVAFFDGFASGGEDPGEVAVGSEPGRIGRDGFADSFKSVNV